MRRRRRTMGWGRGTKLAVASGVIVAVLGSTATVRAYQHEQQKIRRARHALQRSLARETTLHEQLVAAHGATAFARGRTAEHRRGTVRENAATRHVAALASAAIQATATARQTLQVSTVVRAALGISADQARTCVSSEHKAMHHIRMQNRGAAATDLNTGATSCANALAGATGARFPYDFPDPFVLTVGDRYYAFSTNAGAGDVQVITSTDLVNWSIAGNALFGLPSWANPNATWAPAVLDIPAAPAKPASGTTPATPAKREAFVMYYTTQDKASGAQCISSAVSALPAGPYYDRTSGPLVCETADGGSIDPTPFVDVDGAYYLLWKRERALQPSTLRIQRLAPNGRSLVGPAFDLMRSNHAWQHGVIEAPSMIHTSAGYFLFFAGGIWNATSYATGVAQCDTPIGPCHERAAPVMSGDKTVIAPGGASVFTDRQGALWLAYAAYVNPFVGWPYSRTLRFAAVTIGASGVTVRPS